MFWKLSNTHKQHPRLLDRLPNHYVACIRYWVYCNILLCSIRKLEFSRFVRFLLNKNLTKHEKSNILTDRKDSTQRITFHSQEPLQSPRLAADLILRFEQGSRWAQTVQACGCGGSERESEIKTSHNKVSCEWGTLKWFLAVVFQLSMMCSRKATF